MERFAMKMIENWLRQSPRLPLVILGARQVGKTWLMKQFGNTIFSNNYIYVNFEENSSIGSLFDGDIDPARITRQMSLAFGKGIEDDTLLLFDEIQAEPRALNALKYFAEKKPMQPIIASGSLLGLTLRKNAAFPVGKVSFLKLEPLSFSEFCFANGERKLVDYLESYPLEPVLGPLHERLTDLLRAYDVIGGMPQAVQAYVQHLPPQTVDKILDDILLGYERDVARHAEGRNIQKILAVWNSIVGQLAKENRKFIYGNVREGARAREYEDAMQWLVDAGMLRRCVRVGNPAMPLKAFEDPKAFKLYHLDIGLLRRAAKLDASAMMERNSLFSAFRGALAEQFVIQELAAYGIADDPHYWTNGAGTAEVDFVLQLSDGVYPLEVKSGINTRSRSLGVYKSMYHPAASIRMSMNSMTVQNGDIDLPLYAVRAIPAILLDVVKHRS
jgi:predicted AAA+ superfamily ATPase